MRSSNIIARVQVCLRRESRKKSKKKYENSAKENLGADYTFDLKPDDRHQLNFFDEIKKNKSRKTLDASAFESFNRQKDTAEACMTIDKHHLDRSGDKKRLSAPKVQYSSVS